jgi:hypothetical protein
MRRNRLNLRAPRSQPPFDAALSAVKDRWWLSSGPPALSRRQALGLAGMAALGAAPTLNALDEVIGEPFTVSASPQRVTFRLRGRSRWVIDTHRFDGAPRLKFRQNARTLRIVLRGAKYPGTELPADFACVLRRGIVGWRMKFRPLLGNSVSNTPFEKWLAGDVPARSYPQLDTGVCRLGKDTEIRLSGRAQAEFFSDWTLRLEGPRIARLTRGDAELDCGGAEISLLDPRAPSVVEHPPARRTLITLKRGANDWAFEPWSSETEAGRFVATGSAFDVLRIETGRTRSGAVRAALVAESWSDASGLSFQPAEGADGADAQSGSLPLRNALHLVAFDPKGDHVLLRARFGRELAWVRAGSCAFEVGDGGGPPFEIVCRQDRVTDFRCAPALRRVWAPLAGAIVQPAAVPEGSRLELSAAALPAQILPAQQQRNRIVLGKKQPAGVITLSTLVISALRPQDLLALTFQFQNLRLETRQREMLLVRNQPNQPAYILVGFPPQNIAERAFFETADGYPIRNRIPVSKNTSSPPPDPDAGKKSENLEEPPVARRLAGSSRLVFTVPQSVQEIPYTLESLLKSCSAYEQSLAATALPPNLPGLPSGSFQSCEPETFLPVRGLQRSQPQTQPQSQSQSQVQSHPLMMRLEKRAPQTSSAAQARRTSPGQNVFVQEQQFQKQPYPASLIRLLKIEPPGPTETAIECPYRLIISPNRFGGWAHALEPVEGGESKRVELWHTRLGVRCKDRDGNLTVDETGSSELRTLRAIWSPDYPSNARLQENHPFRMSLTGSDRYQLVDLTANYGLKKDDGTPYDPDPVGAERLMLSALGAWMDTRGTWDPPGSLSIEEWRHLATMGRDQFVRVVYRGYLFPFGHRASLIKITERKFEQTPKSKRKAAYLRQRMYIVVREPEKAYAAFGQPHEGRKLPFLSLRTTTLITPSLDLPQGLVPGTDSTSAFWPRVGGTEFLFHFIASDWAGHHSEFMAPVIFVGKDVAFQPIPNAGLQDVFTSYMDASESRQRDFEGQSVTFVESSKPGDTSFETEGILFGAEPPPANISLEQFLREGQPPFYPTVEEAQVRVAAVEQLTGTAARTRIQFHDSYLNYGLNSSQNKGQVFAQLLEKVQLGFGASGAGTDKAGGFVSPNMLIGGLSRTLGPVGGTLESVAAGSFNPQDFFQGALSEAKILGGISLWEILQVIQDFSGMPDRVPKFIPTRLPDALETTFTWKPWVQDQGILTFGDKQNAFSIDAVLRTPLDGKPPTSSVTAELKNFQVHLIPSVLEVLILKFNSLSFKIQNGQKPDVSVDFDDFAFEGPLKFVDTLRHYLPLDGFKDPPSLDVSADGVKLGYTLGVPTVTLGVMSLQNISLSTAFRLPFTGDPINVRFAFSERQNPFLLTVSIFGGGGFFALELEPQDQGLKRLEASFEFGGNFALNLGVASGGVHVMAGIYYAVAGQKTDLSGYLRCGGSLNVLGLITVSVEFKMSLNYASPPTRVWGRATLTVEIEILFFSTSVDLTVERQFAGAQSAALMMGGDVPPPEPLISAVTVEDTMTAGDWAEYCEAFA